MRIRNPGGRFTTLGISAVALLILWLLFLGARGNAGQAQFAVITSLRLAKQHLSELGQQIVLARHGLLPHYDAMNHSLTSLNTDIAALRGSAARMGSPALLTAIQRMEVRSAAQAREIEDFKSANSVLKNSLRYLPYATVDLSNQLYAAGQNGLARTTEQLSRNVLLYNLTAAPELRSRILADADTLRLALSETPWRASAHELRQHAHTIVNYKTRLDTQTGQLLASPLRTAIDQAEQVHLRYQQTLAERENRYRHALAIYAVLLLGAIAWLGYRHTAQADQFKWQATHDSLTGLCNREQLHVEIARLIQHAVKQGGGFTLFLLDLDRFKEINDTLGHQSGDLLLKEIGPRIEKVLPQGCCVARLGGDEFAVLLPGVNQADTSEAHAIHLRSVLSQPFQLDAIVVEVSASLGIVHYPEHGADGSELLRHADVAMYAAKTGDGYVHYAPELDIHSPRRLSIMSDLVRAIREGQLELVYQPKVDLRTRRVTGVEALLRWNHPQLGYISPAEFIPLAEMSDAIHPLTRWVIEMAACQIRIWDKNGLHLNVAVNLSARNLLDDALPQHIQQILDACGVAADRMEMEITESAIMADPRRATRVLDQIDQMGIGLAIDDFGTGYSSLGYLLRLPVDSLKLDRTFVMGLLQQGGEAAIVLSTVQMAHNLGLSVVAEGAEDAATVAALIDADYDTVQGYFFCKPLDAEALAQWLNSDALATLFNAVQTFVKPLATPSPAKNFGIHAA